MFFKTPCILLVTPREKRINTIVNIVQLVPNPLHRNEIVKYARAVNITKQEQVPVLAVQLGNMELMVSKKRATPSAHHTLKSIYSPQALAYHQKPRAKIVQWVNITIVLVRTFAKNAPPGGIKIPNNKLLVVSKNSACSFKSM